MKRLIQKLREEDSTTTQTKPEAVQVVADACRVDVSTLPNAGKGLFANCDLEEGAFIVEYTGKVLNFQQTRVVKDRSYIKAVNFDKHIDASDPSSSSVARYINDIPTSDTRNCKFKTISGRVYVQATKAIAKGEELFIGYGRGHWLYCEEKDLAQEFLSIEIDSQTGHVIATRDLESGIFICTFSSLHWKNRFGPGLAVAIQKTSASFPNANCKFQKNPLLRGTTYVQANKVITTGEKLIMERPTDDDHTGKVGFYVTGFGQFRGVAHNPTTRLVQNLRPFASQLRILGLNILETSIPGVQHGLEQARSVLTAQYSRGKNLVPDTVIYIHFGVNEGAERFQLEMVARNLADFGVPDESGKQPREEPIVAADGPIDRFRCTRLDLDDLQSKLEARGHDVEISTDAGDFICNFAYYCSLRDITPSDWGHDETLFVHVPSVRVCDEIQQLEFARELMRLLANEIIPCRNAVNLR